MPAKLPLSFYQRDTETVARELLGCTLVHIVNGKRISGRIIETEAYLGITDQACHTFGDRRTTRTESMYLPGGNSYVYFIYGMYFCFNVVTRTSQHPEAVLIRALQPLEGLEFMKERRPKAKRERDLANGPGKLCQALAIDRSCDAISLLGDSLFIEKRSERTPLTITASPRIGVDYAGDHALWPLRFTIPLSIA